MHLPISSKRPGMACPVAYGGGGHWGRLENPPHQPGQLENIKALGGNVVVFRGPDCERCKCALVVAAERRQQMRVHLASASVGDADLGCLNWLNISELQLDDTSVKTRVCPYPGAKGESGACRSGVRTSATRGLMRLQRWSAWLSLDLAGTHVDDEAMQPIAAFAKCKASICPNHCDRSRPAGFGEIKQLKALLLSNTRVTDAALQKGPRDDALTALECAWHGHHRRRARATSANWRISIIWTPPRPASPTPVWHTSGACPIYAIWISAAQRLPMPD